jgi:collagenase-like PrtC family protease
MKLSVAANYDLDLVPKLAGLPVSEMYGKFASDAIGGGRPSYMGTPLTPRDLEAYVAALDKQGIAFNYLLNSSCQGNREWSRAWQKKLNRLLDRLGSMGIRRVTVSTPYLLEAVKSRRSGFFVKVGVYAQIDTPRRARFWQDLGADALTLESFSINRDFDALRAIRKSVSCELHLIANHPCLPNCPMQPYHQNGFAHSSDGSRRLFIDHCFLTCTQKRIEDPSLLIKAGWIRPEDTPFYEQMGYEHFKLLERGMPSKPLLERIRAYGKRKSPPNLADLIMPYGFKQASTTPRFRLARHFFRPRQVNPFRLAPFHSILKDHGMLFPLAENPFHIDSREIPADFLAGFEKRKCQEPSCAECGYCSAIAGRCVTVDPAWRQEQATRLKQARALLADGRLWGV